MAQEVYRLRFGAKSHADNLLSVVRLHFNVRHVVDLRVVTLSKGSVGSGWCTKRLVGLLEYHRRKMAL